MIEPKRDLELDPGNTETGSNSAKKQPIQYVYWFITWNGYTKDTLEIILEIFKHECSWFILQEEKGEIEHKLHIQGTLKFLKKKRLTELKKFNKDIHWEPTKQISSSIAYCSNIDKRYGNIWTHNFELPEEIIENNFTPYGWQLDVLEILKTKPDDRTINWFWEPYGGIGKSQLAIWLFNNMNALICIGKTTDIFHIIKKEKKRRKIFIFDITKEKMEYFSYSAIEMIKNGFIISGKYDSCIIQFNRPHVIIFANTPPDQSKLTCNKRWNIINLTNNQDQLDATSIRSNISQ